MAALTTILGPQTLTLHSQASMKQLQLTMHATLHQHSLTCSQVRPALLFAFPFCISSLLLDAKPFTFITFIHTFNVSS